MLIFSTVECFELSIFLYFSRFCTLEMRATLEHVAPLTGSICVVVVLPPYASPFDFLFAVQLDLRLNLDLLVGRHFFALLNAAITIGFITTVSAVVFYNMCNVHIKLFVTEY